MTGVGVLDAVANTTVSDIGGNDISAPCGGRSNRPKDASPARGLFLSPVLTVNRRPESPQWLTSGGGSHVSSALAEVGNIAVKTRKPTTLTQGGSWPHEFQANAYALTYSERLKPGPDSMSGHYHTRCFRAPPIAGCHPFDEPRLDDALKTASTRRVKLNCALFHVCLGGCPLRAVTEAAGPGMSWRSAAILVLSASVYGLQRFTV